MNGHGNGQANAAVGSGMTAGRGTQAGQGTQAEAVRGMNAGVELAVPVRPGGAAQAMPQRSRWGRIWPWALLWGAAPMPLYIWLVVGMMV
jgi:hypothetical protein